MILTACSTQKNTPRTRFWHSFNAKYNTYYNGAMAYVDASLEKEKGNVDNFTEIIPLYPVGNKKSRDLGKGNYDRAIEKSQKAIHQHSIRRRPVWDKRRRKTEKDIEWLNRREYNPFLWKAWMLMGRSQFHQGNFDEAASTFSYMSRLYQTQPAIYGKARAWLAKCYTEQDWLYDAEDVIRNMQRDSIHWKAKKEWDYTYADYYIHTGEYEKAIPYLRKVIRHEMRSKQRARQWFLLGQLEAALGHRENAFKAYRSVLRQNPPYELQFNARIAMTEVMTQGQSKKMIARLRRMAVNDNNAQYLDQVYYAIGNIHLSNGDTLKAIEAYEKGRTKSTRSGVEKGVLLLKLGNLYWEKEKFSDAHRCYTEALGMIDKDRDDYKELSQRTIVLDQLVPHTEAVHMQDSLQELARMPEEERNKAIDKLIEAYKKKLKEERRAQAELANAGNNNGLEDIPTKSSNTTSPTQVNPQQSAVWYFYNPTAVQQGKLSFEQLWGKRENEDDWRRSNKTVVEQLTAEEEYTPEQLDSLQQAIVAEDSLQQAADSLQKDPLKREYYLKQIPLTEEQMAASNGILMSEIYQSAVILKDKMNNLPLSQKYFDRLVADFPDYPQRDDVWYHLYLLHSRKQEHLTAEVALDSLFNGYPESKWTVLLKDPYYEENARFGVHIEDSLYAATYDAFKADRFTEVMENVELSENRFPEGAHRDKFIFVEGMTLLNEGKADGCLERMKTVVEQYPKSELAEMAGMIVKGVNAGRKLRGGRFDIGDVWQRRTEVMTEGDSTEVKTFVNDRNTPFLFMYAYVPDSLNENQLLFELARYNFTSYLVRSFDIEIDDDAGLHRMKVAGFKSYDEALQYARQLYQQRRIAEIAQKARPIIVSEKNFPLLGTAYSYDDYNDYYNKHFAPLKISTYKLLQQPVELGEEPEEEPTVEQIDEQLDDPDFVDNGLDVAEEPEQGTTVVEEQDATIIEEPAEDAVSEDATLVVEEEPEQPASTNEWVIEEDEPQSMVTNEFVVEEETTAMEEPEDAIVVEEEPAVKAQPAVIKTQPAELPKLEKPVLEPTRPVQQSVSPKEDTGIYFDDGFGAPEDVRRTNTKQNNSNAEKKKPQKFDLEDEYYDLDGF